VTDSVDDRSFIPDGWHTVTPRIVVRDPMRFMEFLASVFRATGEFQVSRPSVVRLGDSNLMVSEAGIRPPTISFLYVYVQDVDATYRRAVDAGARAIEEPFETPTGIVVAWWKTRGATPGKSPPTSLGARSAGNNSPLFETNVDRRSASL
jgi:PhnB protein